MNTENSRTELKSLQAGRGIAAFAVVIFHANLTLALPKYFGVEPAPWAAGGDSGVHFFFVLSGLIMVLAHWGDIGSGATPIAFWWRRIRRIIPPLWVALCLATLGHYLVFRDLPNTWTLLSAFTVAPIEPDTILAVEWTLRHEMVFYALFGLLIWRRWVGGSMLAAWLALSVVGGLREISGPLHFWMSPYHILFGVGCLAGVALKREIALPRPALWFAVGAIVFAACWAAKVLGVALPRLALLAGYGAGAAMMLVSIANLERQGRLQIGSMLELLGNASYSIYLVHFPLVSMLAKVAFKAQPHYPAPLIVWFFIMTALAMAGGITFYIFIEKPLLKLIPARLGRRPMARQQPSPQQGDASPPNQS